MDEYERRLVPASVDEIIALAEQIWSNPVLQAAIKKAGIHGDFSEENQERIDVEIDNYRQDVLWNRDRLHLALAPCLLRQIAAGKISNLSDADARKFIQERMVERIGRGFRPAKTTREHVLDYADAMKNNSEIWSIFLRVKTEHHLDEVEDQALFAFRKNYLSKYGLYNLDPAALGFATRLLRKLAAGEINDLKGSTAKEILSRGHFFIK